jgi:HK97 gp10 family phage protein
LQGGDGVSVVVTGIQSLIAEMERIDRQMNSKVVRPATLRALSPIRKRAKANAPSESLKKLISAKAFVSKKKKEVKGKVYLKPDKKRTIKLQGREVGFEVVGNILEFGSVKQNIRPRPFMRPAAAEGAAEAKNILEKEIRERLKKL